MRVLILEDDPLIALDLQAIVEGEGHDVVEVCASLASARRRVGDAFDFALLDVDIADGKSYEIASALCDRAVPFAFVSASRPAELPQNLRHACFIPKPYEERTIVQSIEGLCRRG